MRTTTDQPAVSVARAVFPGTVADVELALREGRMAATAQIMSKGELAVHPGLLAVSNVVLTPHTASAIFPTGCARVDPVAANLIAALTGRVPPSAPNAWVLSRCAWGRCSAQARCICRRRTASAMAPMATSHAVPGSGTAVSTRLSKPRKSPLPAPNCSHCTADH